MNTSQEANIVQFKKSDVEVNHEINYSAAICKKIKEAFYKDEKWNMTLVRKVAEKFGIFKTKTRKCFEGQTDLEYFKATSKWSHEDIQDVINN